MFDRYNSIFTMTSIKQDKEYFNLRFNIQLDHPEPYLVKLWNGGENGKSGAPARQLKERGEEGTDEVA